MLDQGGLPARGHLRDETAGQRDQAAQKRDERAARRDHDADVAERRVLELEGGDGIGADEPTRRRQELRARTVEDHKRAAGDRIWAKRDRESGQRDRAESKRDREQALVDGRSLALAERTSSDLAHQRSQLINAQSVGQFGSWEWDIANDTTEWSGELYRARGLEPGGDHMSLEDFIEGVHPEDRVLVRSQIHRAYETGEPFSFEHRIVRPDGDVRIIHARGEVLMRPQGTPVKMCGTGQDITDRREVERAKDEFISVVSHELRTPLTSIRAALGLLQSGVLGPLPDQGQRMIKIAVENTDRLVRLINDLLDMERLDFATIDVHQPCDAAELIQRAIQGLEHFATGAQVSLTAEGKSTALVADPDRVLQTLTNLIGNAVRFSPPNSTVRVRCERRDGEVAFQVADEGRGIPADKLESIFGRFQQVDASDSREKGGTGLGLAICRRIVEHHSGRIWVDSELGVGSTFWFVLPADQSTGSPQPHTGDKP